MPGESRNHSLKTTRSCWSAFVRHYIFKIVEQGESQIRRDFCCQLLLDILPIGSYGRLRDIRP